MAKTIEDIMGQINDQHFIDFCEELKAYVEEHGHFPPKHTKLLHKVKYTRKKINQGVLEDWKKERFLAIADSRVTAPATDEQGKAEEPDE